MSDVTHILSKVSCFLLKSFHFVCYGNDRFFSHTNPYILNVTQQCRCSPMLIFRAWAACGVMCCQYPLGNSSNSFCEITLRAGLLVRIRKKNFGQRGKVSSPKFSPNWHRWACSLAIAKLLLIRTPF